MSDELKPCPFCGKIPSLKKSNDKPPYVFVKFDHFCEHGKDAFHTHVETKWCKTYEEAAKLWNRRAE